MIFLSCTDTLLDEVQHTEEGPIKDIDPSMVSKEPRQMYDGFEWVTMDLTDDKEVKWPI